jgi:hypothetical protein
MLATLGALVAEATTGVSWYVWGFTARILGEAAERRTS